MQAPNFADIVPKKALLWIMFLGLLDPDPLLRCTDPDPDPSIIMQNIKKNLYSYSFVTSF
jgi:hypothetical protein